MSKNTRAIPRLRLRWMGAAFAVLILAAAIMALRYWKGMEPQIVGGPPGARLISAEQYANTIHDVFGDDLRVVASFAPPPRREGLLTLGAAEMVATAGLLAQFDTAARGVAAQVVEERRRRTLISCEPRAASEPDDICAARFFSQVGQFLFRRPLSEEERNLYVTAARNASVTFKDFYAGIAHSLATMLVSPKFLYLSETVESDPEHPGHHRLDAWSKATRLSLFLWDSVPDAALLAAAATGELHERAGLERQVERLLNAPERLERGTRAFFSDLLLLDKFDGLTKDPVIYPAFTRSVAEAAREQILRLITDQLLRREADYRGLFTTPDSFVNGVLAPIQRVPTAGAGWVSIKLQSQHHAGLITTPGFLAVNSHPGRSSPTLRGKAIREALLCQKVPEPPPNVNFTSFEGSLETMKTARERLDAHATDAVCAGCHKITDPIGLALENFDGAAQFRLTEKGGSIDPSGQLDGSPFADLAAFGQAMRTHPALVPCLVSRLYSYATGHQSAAGDRPWLAHIGERFADDDYRYRALLRRMAVSPAFYAVTVESSDQKF